MTNGTTQTPRIAVIGSGISGLASAWMLSQQYDVTLLEKTITSADTLIRCRWRRLIAARWPSIPVSLCITNPIIRC